MTGFVQFCSRLAPLDKQAADDLCSTLHARCYQKDEYLLRQGEVSQNLFFIEEGLVKIFFNKNDKEFIMRFFSENEMLTILDSFLKHTSSEYFIKALEPTTVIFIRNSELNELCARHHCIESFFGRLTSMAAANMMSRISEMLEENAASRYDNFVQRNAGLLRRISLGDLAKYLGITQVSLSRIRAKK